MRLLLYNTMLLRYSNIVEHFLCESVARMSLCRSNTKPNVAEFCDLLFRMISEHYNRRTTMGTTRHKGAQCVIIWKLLSSAEMALIARWIRNSEENAIYTLCMEFRFEKNIWTVKDCLKNLVTISPILNLARRNLKNFCIYKKNGIYVKAVMCFLRNTARNFHAKIS